MYLKRMLVGGALGGALVLGAAMLSQAGAAVVGGTGCTAPTAGQQMNMGTATTGTSASASVSECVTISVPGVVALHLHETSWNLDLGNLGANSSGQTQCYRAGNHDYTTGRDVLYDISGALAKATWSGDGVAASGNPYSFAGTAPTFGGTNGADMLPVSSYPGYVADANGNVVWKGPIVCFNRKIVEKFSNSATGWTFTAGLSNATSGFPSMLLGDIVASGTSTPNAPTFAVLTPGGTAQTLASGSGTTGGWLDDYILEGVLFNGSEQAGTQSANVVFQLTSNF